MTKIWIGIACIISLLSLPNRLGAQAIVGTLTCTSGKTSVSADVFYFAIHSKPSVALVVVDFAAYPSFLSLESDSASYDCSIANGAVSETLHGSTGFLAQAVGAGAGTSAAQAEAFVELSFVYSGVDVSSAPADIESNVANLNCTSYTGGPSLGFPLTAFSLDADVKDSVGIFGADVSNYSTLLGAVGQGYGCALAVGGANVNIPILQVPPVAGFPQNYISDVVLVGAGAGVISPTPQLRADAYFFLYADDTLTSGSLQQPALKTVGTLSCSSISTNIVGFGLGEAIGPFGQPLDVVNFGVDLSSNAALENLIYQNLGTCTIDDGINPLVLTDAVVDLVDVQGYGGPDAPAPDLYTGLQLSYGSATVGGVTYIPALPSSVNGRLTAIRASRGSGLSGDATLHFAKETSRCRSLHLPLERIAHGCSALPALFR